MTTNNPQSMQRQYYTQTAARYDSMHVHADDEHYRALGLSSALMDLYSVRSVLDVGCGTGRAAEYLARRRPGVSVVGVEPVPALLERGRDSGRATGPMVCGSGDRLPFPDASFDCVCEFGVLHHVPRPRVLVAEMMRVSRRMIVLSDENRFGMRSRPVQLLKLGIFKLGLWRPFYWAMTRGKNYQYTQGDGVRYSYSVYDCFDTLADWGDHLLAIPTDPVKPRSWMHPLFTSGHVLLCALRDNPKA